MVLAMPAREHKQGAKWMAPAVSKAFMEKKKKKGNVFEKVLLSISYVPGTACALELLWGQNKTPS